MSYTNVKRKRVDSVKTKLNVFKRYDKKVSYCQIKCDRNN